jgi:hypothetical protein
MTSAPDLNSLELRQQNVSKLISVQSAHQQFAEFRIIITSPDDSSHEKRGAMLWL